ncbi:MAG: hypothetical protein ACFNZW_09610, partial [Coriobacteriaceae bacterium]
CMLDRQEAMKATGIKMDSLEGLPACMLCCQSLNPTVHQKITAQGAAGLKRAMRKYLDGSIQRREVPGQHRAGAHKVEVRKDERFGDDEVAR